MPYPALLKSLLSAALEDKKSIVLNEQFFSAASAKELSSIFFAGTADKNHSIRLTAAFFFGSD